MSLHSIVSSLLSMSLFDSFFLIIIVVGRALASTEENAYPIFESLDVDYVLVIFGGVTGYSSDDINKFLWPVRIGSG